MNDNDKGDGFSNNADHPDIKNDQSESTQTPVESGTENLDNSEVESGTEHPDNSEVQNGSDSAKENDSQKPYEQNNPYGRDNQYGQNNQYVNTGRYNYYDNPYGAPQNNIYGDNPYSGQYGQNPQSPKKKSTGLKVFLWALIIVAVSFVGGIIYFSVQPVGIGQNSSASSSSSSQSDGGANSGSASSGGKVVGGVQGDGTNPNTDGITIQSKPLAAKTSADVVYKKVIQSVVGIQTTISDKSLYGKTATSEGTGIVATSDGYIITNAHVVNYSRSNKVKVILHNNQEYEAKVTGYDKTSDIAVLKINATGLSPANFGSVDNMQIGDVVIAIGNPGGMSFAGSLSGGYISALDRTIEAHSDNGMTYIQTDTAINPGNSGGPLVNMYGQVIGINSNKIIGYEGMGFSIPVSRAKTIINSLMAKGYVSGRCRLGIIGGTVPDEYRQLYKYPQGVLIQSVSSDSSLKGLGIVKGDIITKAGGKDITGMDDLYAVLNDHKPGDIISMQIYSTAPANLGKKKTVSVKLLEDKGETQKSK